MLVIIWLYELHWLKGLYENGQRNNCPDVQLQLSITKHKCCFSTGHRFVAKKYWHLQASAIRERK